MTSTTRTPPGLGTRGRKLWRAITGEFELPEHEAGLLLEACRTSDDLDRLAAVVAAEGVVVDGKPHPALVEARQLRIVLSRLVASLRVPDDPDDATGRPQRRGGSRGHYRPGAQP